MIGPAKKFKCLICFEKRTETMIEPAFTALGLPWTFNTMILANGSKATMLSDNI